MKRLIIVGSPRVEGRSGALADLLFESCIEECPEDEVFLAPVSTLEVAGCNACDWCKRGSAVLPNGGDADVAATCGSASRGEAGDLRTEVRGASAFPTGCTTTGALADASEPASSNPIPAQPDLTRKHYLQGAGIGLVAGLASGYVGVGGGFIMVPMMLAILSIPMSLASGTSLIAIMILAIPGVIEQAILGNINYFAGISIVVGTIPGAVIGARLVRVIPERQLRFAFGGFLLVAAVLLMLNEFGILG